MLTDPAAVPYDLPPAHHLSGEQSRSLAAAAAGIRGLLQAALARTGARCLAASEPGLVWEPGALWDTEWSVQAAWRQVSRWRLLLSPGAAEAVLAAQLGQEALAEHAMTDLDLRLLELPARQLAAGLARELPVRAGGSVPEAHPEITMNRGGAPAETEAAVVWRVTVQGAQTEGEALLLAPWEQLSRVVLPPPDERRLRPRDLEQAPVFVEAITVAAPVTTRELAEMQPGDVLLIGPADRPSVVMANGKAFARGRPGAKGAHLAINIQEISSPGPGEG